MSFDKPVTFKVKGQSKTRNYDSKYKGLFQKTCNDFHLAISEVFKLLHDDAGLSENPFAKIPKLKREKLMSLPDFMGLAEEESPKQLGDGKSSVKERLIQRIGEMTEEEAEELLLKLNG